jgi:uncharacterized membrane protein
MPMKRIMHAALRARRTLLGMTVVLCGLGLEVPAAHAVLTVCNKTTTGKIYFDLSRGTTSCSTSWNTTGWFQPTKGQCITVWNVDMRGRAFRWGGFDENGRQLNPGNNGEVTLPNAARTNMCWETAALTCSNPNASCRLIGYAWPFVHGRDYTITITDRQACYVDSGSSSTGCSGRP